MHINILTLKKFSKVYVETWCMIHIGQLIEQQIHEQERSATWLAKKLYCDRTNVYSIFKRKSLDTELLLRISRILNFNFFDYYVNELYNNTSEEESEGLEITDIQTDKNNHTIHQ